MSCVVWFTTTLCSLVTFNKFNGGMLALKCLLLPNYRKVHARLMLLVARRPLASPIFVIDSSKDRLYSRILVDRKHPFSSYRTLFIRQDLQSVRFCWGIKPTPWSGGSFWNILLVYKFVISYIYSLVCNGIRLIPSQTNVRLGFCDSFHLCAMFLSMATKMRLCCQENGNNPTWRSSSHSSYTGSRSQYSPPSFGVVGGAFAEPNDRRGQRVAWHAHSSCSVDLWLSLHHI